MNSAKYTLLDWIPAIASLDWKELSKNPNAIHLLESELDRAHQEHRPDRINWTSLSENPNAIHLLEANQDKIDWKKLSTNPNAIRLLSSNPDKIVWCCLSENPNAIHLLEAEIAKGNQEKIYWSDLSVNPNPKAIHLLEENFREIDWCSLCENPSAIHLIERELGVHVHESNRFNLFRNPNAVHIIEKIIKKNEYLDGIELLCLSMNPNAVHILERYARPSEDEIARGNPEKIDWGTLSLNPNAIHLIEAELSNAKRQNRPDKINYFNLCRNPNAMHIVEEHIKNNPDVKYLELFSNPSIFKLDYKKMKKALEPLKRELVEKTMHPKRLERILRLAEEQLNRPLTLDDYDRVL